MTDWRSWAKHGLWTFVEFDPEADAGREEIAELRDVLELVVPMVPPEAAGGGLLTPARRALQSDDSFLRKHVDEGNYERDLKAVRRKYCHFPDPPKIQERLTRAAGRCGGEFELLIHQLKFAASILEKLYLLASAGEPDTTAGWLALAEEVAVRALHEEGVEYRGLDVTFVHLALPETARGRTSDRDGTSEQVTLRALTAEDSSMSYTKVWHAAVVLLHLEMARMLLRAGVDGPDDRSLWNPRDVRRHLHAFGARAFTIGYHCHAIDAAVLEGPARKHLTQESNRDRAVAARTGAMAEDTPLKLAAMEREIIANGGNVSAAARKVAKEFDTSPSALRKLHYDRRKAEGS